MKHILILVDMQNGFTRHDQTKQLVERIASLLHLRVFDHVITTRFMNYDHSIYEKLFAWHGVKTQEEQKLCRDFDQYSDFVVEKTVYSCVNPHFLQRLCQLNDGVYPQKVYVAGVDTDCCVLKIATDLFEHNICPIVLSHYCASNGGIASHEAGILCMKRLIGEKQIWDKQITHKNDL